MPDNKKNNALAVIDAMHQRFVNPPDFYVSSLGVCVRNPAARNPPAHDLPPIFSVTEADFEELPDYTDQRQGGQQAAPTNLSPPPPDMSRLVDTVVTRAAKLEAENKELRTLVAEALEDRARQRLSRSGIDKKGPTIH